jgi:hypothetical protein
MLINYEAKVQNPLVGKNPTHKKDSVESFLF